VCRSGEFRVQTLTSARSGGARIIIKFDKKKLQHIYRDLHKKLQANNKKIKEIAQFIKIYIRNSTEFT